MKQNLLLRHKPKIVVALLISLLAVVAVFATTLSLNQAHASINWVHPNAVDIVSVHDVTRNGEAWVTTAINRREVQYIHVHIVPVSQWRANKTMQIEMQLERNNGGTASLRRNVELIRVPGILTSWSAIMSAPKTVRDRTLTSWDYGSHDDDTFESIVTNGEWTYFLFIYERETTGSFPAVRPIAIHSHVIHITYGDVDDNTIPLPPPPAAPHGYVFAGWYFDSNFTQPHTGQPITQDTNLFARFAPITFNITYTLNGGALPTGAITTFNIESGNVVLPIPTRPHFDFAGWFTTTNFSGNAVTYIPNGSTGNRTFFARWTARSYTITINLNSGVLPISVPETYTIESPLIVIPNPTRSGFTFEGWYANANFTGSRVASIATGSTGNRAFYARWDIIEFTIQYHLNGGVAVGTPRHTFTIECDMITLPTVHRQGYEFLGWFTTANFLGNSVTAINAGSTGNRVFFARWERKTFRVTFWVGGVIFSELYVPYGMALADFNLVNPSTHQAIEVFANPELTVAFDLYTEINGTVMLFATSPFSIQVQLTRNVLGVETIQSLGYNTVLQNALPTPILEGFDFLGWYYDEHFTRRVLATDRITTNTTIFARMVESEPERNSFNMPLWAWAVVVGAVLIIVVSAVVAIKKKRGGR